MAFTSIADMQIVPHKFAEYTIQRTTEKSMLVKSGITTSNPVISRLINGQPKGSNMITMPHFNPLTGEDQVFGEYTLDSNKITTGNEVATILVRQAAWRDTDLSYVMGGADPMSAIANLVADWWNIREQHVMLAVLKGLFATNGALNNSTVKHVLDVSSEAGTDSIIGVDNTLDAKNLMGDAYDKLGLVFMHSATYTKLQKQQNIDTQYDSDLKIKIDYYLGYQVIVDDSMPVTDGVYDTYFLGKGCFARNDGMLEGLIGYEIDRDKLSAENYLINRRCLIMHPLGISFNANADMGYKDAPTNTIKNYYADNSVLSTAANWTLATDHKNVAMVCMRHRIEPTT